MKVLSFLSVVLLCFLAGCKSDEGDSGSPAPVAGFVNPGSPVFTDTVRFTNTSVNADVYAWDFGNGQTSTEQNGLAVFPDFGNYLISLAAIQLSTGRSDTARLTLTYSPRTVVLEGVILQNFPIDNPDGNGWDGNDHFSMFPDVFLSLVVDRTVYWTSSINPDLGQGNLPFSIPTLPELTIAFEDFSLQFQLRVYDSDGNDVRELMGNIPFVFNDLISDHGYISIIPVEGSPAGNSAGLALRWE